MHDTLNRAGETPRQAKQRVSRHGGAALIGMLMPAIAFPCLLIVAALTSERFAFLRVPARWPTELYVLAIAGIVATLGGLADWLFHRSGETAVGKPEHDAHVLALLAGGGPMFALMVAASVIRQPAPLLLPILLVLLWTTALICYDEFAFHVRRCERYETLTHRLLVFGNGIAWLAWMHWIYVRPAIAGD